MTNPDLHPSESRPKLPRVGVVAYSFGQRQHGSSPANLAIAAAVARAVEEFGVFIPPFIVAQWEVTETLRNLGIEPDLEIKQRPGIYLDTDAVWREASRELQEHNIREVVLVAQPFLHLHHARILAKRDGMRSLKFEVGIVPFDDTPENTQPWTRSRCALTTYAIRRLVTGRRGKGESPQPL